MNKLYKILVGENLRKGMEGASAVEIQEIMSSQIENNETSPFAEVLGYHIFSTENDEKIRGKAKVKPLRRARRR